jgi:hypothetical protein
MMGLGKILTHSKLRDRGIDAVATGSDSTHVRGADHPQHRCIIAYISGRVRIELYKFTSEDINATDWQVVG